ncbi:MAG: lamin tail domain-containing protein, partial [Myxococcota bacterium]
LGTPGEANPICEDVPACEPNPCTEPPESVCDRNTAVSYVTEGSCRDINGVAECTYEELRDFCGGGQVCSEGACVEPSSPPAAEGDIIITEIMYNPSGSGFDDDDAEWIELYNTNSGDRDLSGCLFKDNNPSNDGAPLTDVVVPGGGYIIVGKSSDPQYFGGVTPAATFSFGLNNSNEGDAVILECGGEVFDRIDYDDGGAFPEGTGASLSLDPSARNNDDNGDGANWCLGAEDYAGGNLGSPGRANPSCPTGGDVCDPNPCTTPPVAICEGDTLVTYMAQGTCADAGGAADCTYPEDTRTDCTDGAQICFQGFNPDEPARCTDDPGQGMPPSLGEIEITEVMYNPAEISDNVGEWVELYNITFGDRNLSGCVLKDDPMDEGSPLTGVVLGTGAYGIIGRSTDPANFGGVTPLGTFNFGLNNDGDSLILECDGIEFDRLDYTNGGDFPTIDNGASLSASGGQWCAATSLYDEVNGNLGTPGAVNPPCEGTGGACTVATTGSITAPGTYMGDNTDASNDFSRPEDACTDGDGVDEVWVLTVGSATSVCVDTLGTEMNGAGLDTILYVRTSCTDANTEVGCNDDIDFDLDIYDSRVGFDAQPGVQYFVIVEGYGSLDIGTYMLNVAFDACP